MELYEKVLYVNRWLNAGTNRVLRLIRLVQEKQIDLPISCIVLTVDNFVTIVGYVIGMDTSINTRISIAELDGMVSAVKQTKEKELDRATKEAKEESNT